MLDVNVKQKFRRCLVTGAGGFLGAALARALSRSGFVVSAFGRRSNRLDNPPDIRWISGDFADPTSLMRACEDQDAVFHLLSSSIPSSSTKDPAADIISNVVPTVKLLEACCANKVKRFIFASSGGTIYGNADCFPTPETAPTRPLSAYGISKLALENYIEMFYHVHGLDYRILRVSNPYGPGQSPYKKQGVVASFLHCMITGLPVEIWGDGSVVRDYIYVDDVINAFANMLSHSGDSKIFNVSSGVGLSIVDILEICRRGLGDWRGDVVYKGSRNIDVHKSILDNALLSEEIRWLRRRGLAMASVPR